MANPCGTRTPCPDSFWNISPSDAFFPPTSGTSSMPNSSKKRTYLDVLMTCPLIARQAICGIELDAHLMLRRTRPVRCPTTPFVVPVQERSARSRWRFVAVRPIAPQLPTSHGGTHRDRAEGHSIG